MNPFRTFRVGVALCALLLAVTLGGCHRRDSPAGAVAPADAASTRMAADRAAADSRRATAAAVHAAATAENDITITSKVRYHLSSDADLGLKELSVETHDGHVSLRGTSPDAASRDRATQVAAAVDGVAAVDNRMTVLH